MENVPGRHNAFDDAVQAAGELRTSHGAGACGVSASCCGWCSLPFVCRAHIVADRILRIMDQHMCTHRVLCDDALSCDTVPRMRHRVIMGAMQMPV